MGTHPQCMGNDQERFPCSTIQTVLHHQQTSAMQHVECWNERVIRLLFGPRMVCLERDRCTLRFDILGLGYDSLRDLHEPFQSIPRVLKFGRRHPLQWMERVPLQIQGADKGGVSEQWLCFPHDRYESLQQCPRGSEHAPVE